MGFHRYDQGYLIKKEKKNQIIGCQKDKERKLSKRKVWSAVLLDGHIMYCPSKILTTTSMVNRNSTVN